MYAWLVNWLVSFMKQCLNYRMEKVKKVKTEDDVKKRKAEKPDEGPVVSNIFNLFPLDSFCQRTVILCYKTWKFVFSLLGDLYISK